MEDLREGIAKIYWESDEHHMAWGKITLNKTKCYQFSDQILTYLKSQGVVEITQLEADHIIKALYGWYNEDRGLCVCCETAIAKLKPIATSKEWGS